jgi:hypothetical protein
VIICLFNKPKNSSRVSIIRDLDNTVLNSSMTAPKRYDFTFYFIDVDRLVKVYTMLCPFYKNSSMNGKVFPTFLSLRPEQKITCMIFLITLILSVSHFDLFSRRMLVKWLVWTGFSNRTKSVVQIWRQTRVALNHFLVKRMMLNFSMFRMRFSRKAGLSICFVNKSILSWYYT